MKIIITEQEAIEAWWNQEVKKGNHLDEDIKIEIDRTPTVTTGTTLARCAFCGKTGNHICGTC